MRRSDFLRELENELSLPSGSLEEGHTLASLKEWDSMAAVQFIALADENVGLLLNGQQIAGAKTVADLLSLLGDRLSD